MFIDFSDIHSKVPSQKWLTNHSKYNNICAGVGDSAARQTGFVRSMTAQFWPTVYAYARIRNWQNTRTRARLCSGATTDDRRNERQKCNSFKNSRAAHRASVSYTFALVCFDNDQMVGLITNANARNFALVYFVLYAYNLFSQDMRSKNRCIQGYFSFASERSGVENCIYWSILAQI